MKVLVIVSLTLVVLCSFSVANAQIIPGAPPVITSIMPNNGPEAGGNVATIAGSNFSSGVTVAIGSVPVPVVSSTATEIIFVMGASNAGDLYDVTVTNDNGESAKVPYGWMVDYDDVPSSHLLQPFVEAVSRALIVYGCDVANYCLDAPVSRGSMASFLLKAKHGSSYYPGTASGTVFIDVPANYPSARWIEQLAAQGITAGCAPSRYCPENQVTRGQMAVFLLTAHDGTLNPPPATGFFSDVPMTSPFARWIEELYRRGITAGCATNPPRYCPNAAITKGEMAVLMTTMWGLPRD